MKLYKNIIEEFRDILQDEYNDIDIITNLEQYEPALREPFIRLTLMPVEPVNVSQGMNSIQDHTVTMNIDIFTPRNTSISLDYAKEIVEILNYQRYREYFTIDRAWKTTDIIDEEWLRSTLICRYHA